MPVYRKPHVSLALTLGSTTIVGRAQTERADIQGDTDYTTLLARFPQPFLAFGCYLRPLDLQGQFVELASELERYAVLLRQRRADVGYSRSMARR